MEKIMSLIVQFVMKLIVILVVFIIFCSSQSIGIRRYDEDLHENDPCGIDPSAYSGKCKKIRECVNVLVEQRDIEICSFDNDAGDSTLVCCSRADFYKSQNRVKLGSLDYDTCQEKYKSLRKVEAEEFASFTINGVDVKPFEFPHIAALGWLQWVDFSVAWNCGGSLITESYVVTAAHCTKFNGIPPNVVRLGDTDLHSIDDDQYVQQFGVLKVTKHPAYTFSLHDFDIALVQLNGRVVPTVQVCPVCVLSSDASTEYFEAAGYGQDVNGLQNSKLSKVQLKMVESDTCQESYSGMELRSHQICAQSYDELVQDTCYGDSGSPLQYIEKKSGSDGSIYQTPTLVGLTSFGIGCAYGYPSVYTNATYFIDWMETIIEP